MALKINSLITFLVVLFGITAAAPALAADPDTIVVRQQSAVNSFGSWKLQRPNGLYTGSSSESQTISHTAAGLYSLDVTPARPSSVNITVTENGELIHSSGLNSTGFRLSEGSAVEIVISYADNGTVIVKSEPSGKYFRLVTDKYGNYQGRTPKTFTGMVPTRYTVYYETSPGCDPVKPLSRDLGINDTLELTYTYSCSPVQSNNYNYEYQDFLSEKEENQPVINYQPPAGQLIRLGDNIRLQQVADKQEAWGGETVNVSLRVTNVGAIVLNNVIVTEKIDGQKVYLAGPVPANGDWQDGRIMWVIDTLPPGQSWVVGFPVRLKSDFKAGDLTVLTAQVTSGAYASAQPIENLAASVGIGTPYLPVTGVPYDILFIVLASAMAGGLICVIKFYIK